MDVDGTAVSIMSALAAVTVDAGTQLLSVIFIDPDGIAFEVTEISLDPETQEIKAMLQPANGDD